MDQELKTFLNKHNILYSEYTHPAVFTVAESDKLTKHIPCLRTKNLFLRDNLGGFYLMCMPSAKRLDIKHLKKYLQIKELKFATPEELAAELQLKPGSVSPLAMIHAKHTILLIDENVWNAEEIGVHPNKNTSTLVLKHEAFERFCSTLSALYKVIPNA